MRYHINLSKTGKNFNKLLIVAVILVLIIIGTVLFWHPEIDLPNRGVWDGRTYTNSEIGISLTVPDDWRIMSDEELIESLDYSSDFYENMQSHSNYIDAMIYKNDDAGMYIQYYASGTTSQTAWEQAESALGQLKNVTTYEGIQYPVVVEDIMDIKIGGLTYARLAYTLSGKEDYKFIQYYRCLQGESGDIFVQLNITILDGTSEDEFLALFNQM